MRPPGQTDTVPEAEADALLSGKILRLLKTVLYNGVPAAARLMTSLRVGTGAATLAALDGSDGQVVADGALAGFTARDRADSTKWFTLFRNNTIGLATQAATLWTIDATTGLITQPSWTAITLVNTWTGTCAYRQEKPGGEVVFRGSIAPGGSGLAASFFTMPSGNRPTLSGNFVVSTFGGGGFAYGTINVDTAGVMTPFVPAGTTNIYLDSLTYPTS